MKFDCLLEIRSHLLYYFEGNNDKVEMWLNTKNPMLGGISPLEMLMNDKETKLLKFIKEQMKHNQ